MASFVICFPKSAATVSISGTFIEANLPVFHWSMFLVQLAIIDQTWSSKSSSTSVEAVSAFAGGSIAKMPKPAFMSFSLARIILTASRYCAISASASSTDTSAVKGAFRRNSLRWSMICERSTRV